MTDRTQLLRELKDIRKAASLMMKRAEKVIQSLEDQPQNTSAPIEKMLERRRNKIVKRML